MTLPATPQTRSIPTQEVLEGLARLHPFVLLANRAGRIEWMSEELRDHLREDTQTATLEVVGEENPPARLIAHLPHPEQLDLLGPQSCRGAIGEEVRAESHPGSLHIGIADGTQLCFAADGFPVASTSEDVPQYVVIARPPGEHSERASLATHPRESNRPSGDLQASIDMLSQVVESSPHGVIVVDGAGYVSHANPRAAELLGRTHTSLAGSPFAALLPTSPGFEKLLGKLREPTGWDGVEIEHLDEKGRSTWVSVSTRALRGEDGNPIGVIAYLRDFTERREVQRQLERKNQELESYVDSVAHDLRSPLVSLLGFTRLLKQDYQDTLDETGHHFLDRVEQAGRTMDALIHDLLELSRIRRPGEILSLTDPRRILLQVEAELKLRLEESDVVLDLPEEPPMMAVDGTRLYQIFSNLIGNALTYGLAGKGPSRIRVEILEREAEHEIVVSDDGRGVPEEDHERIFGVFQTGRGVRRDEQSHGIGLAIVKKIAEAHGGQVFVESIVDEGASFHVVFPGP